MQNLIAIFILFWVFILGACPLLGASYGLPRSYFENLIAGFGYFLMFCGAVGVAGVVWWALDTLVNG